LAIAAAARAAEGGARPLVLPTIPIGNNAQQLDQVATLHLSTSTAAALLADIGRSLRQQGFDRLLLLNGHGGNEFKPLVRDLQQQLGLWVIVANFYQLLPQRRTELFSAPGDHADQSETSLMLHLEPQLVELQHAGSGLRRPFEIAAIDQPGVWTPRPWSHVHPDTGSGDPRGATAELGAAYFEALVGALSELIVAIDQAQPGQLPFCVSHTTTA
jgi:creatinine amidohydrolase